jgi:cellulose biosynthesis protein BcsQ
MHLVVVDLKPEARAALLGRAREAIRQVGIKRVEPIEVDVLQLESFDWSLAIGCLMGVGCEDSIEQLVPRLKSLYSNGKIGATLSKQGYLANAVELRKKLDITVLTEGDLAQIANFAIDCERQASTKGKGFKNRGVVGVIQLKGGVGSTTVVSALGSCWARNGLHTAAVDFDDFSAHLTSWGRVGAKQRKALSDYLRLGEVPQGRLNEILSPVESFEGNYCIVGQPESYQEAFHFKANVLEEVPSAHQFVTSLIESLREEYDAVVLDLGRSWGIGTFAALPLCSSVLVVCDDDPLTVKRSIETLKRLKAESDDPEEFDFSKWTFLLNAVTGYLLKPAAFEAEIRALDMFPPATRFFSIRYSVKGRNWGSPGVSLYDCAEPKVRSEVRALASGLIPFFAEEGKKKENKGPISLLPRLKREKASS